MKNSFQNIDAAYIVGIAIGDGNLSNPNKRAVRLRVTCDAKYPKLIEHIRGIIEKILPFNKVSLVKRKESCVDISCYSNHLEEILGWKVGTKYSQQVNIPNWISKNKKYTITCLRGLFQTDGSIYKDREYTYVNFTTNILPLAETVAKQVEKLGYKPQLRKVNHANKTKYVIRISKDVESFIGKINLWKE